MPKVKKYRKYYINAASAHTIHVSAKDMDAIADYSRSVDERIN